MKTWIVALVLLTSACEATQVAPTAGSTTPAPVVPAHGAPPVAHPFPSTAFAADPCSVVDSAHIAAIGVREPGSRRTQPGVTTCERTSLKSETVFTVRVYAPSGLTWHYERAEGKEYPLWRPIPDLEGFPAAIHNAQVPMGYDGCAIAVGMRDDIALDFDLLWQLGVNIRDLSPCEEVERYARELVSALKTRS